MWFKKFEKYFDDGADMVIASRLMPGGYFKSDKNILWIHRKLFLIFITFIILACTASQLSSSV